MIECLESTVVVRKMSSFWEAMKKLRNNWIAWLQNSIFYLIEWFSVIAIREFGFHNIWDSGKIRLWVLRYSTAFLSSLKNADWEKEHEKENTLRPLEVAISLVFFAIFDGSQKNIELNALAPAAFASWLDFVVDNQNNEFQRKKTSVKFSCLSFYRWTKIRKTKI